MRDITTHRVNPVNDKLTLKVIESPAGEPTTYQIGIPQIPDVTLNFQHGPINEVGVNGVTNEVLLAIVRDRLEYFQKGPYSCRENALALTKVEEAAQWLHARTLRRMQAGTEGTSAPDYFPRVQSA